MWWTRSCGITGLPIWAIIISDCALGVVAPLGSAPHGVEVGRLWVVSEPVSRNQWEVILPRNNLLGSGK